MKPIIPLENDGSYSDTLLAYDNAMTIIENFLEDSSVNSNKPYSIEDLMFPSSEYRDELNSILMSESKPNQLREE
jgi:hypothetical protein